MSSVPKTMRAVVQNEGEMKASVQEVPVPELEENDILIKVHYAAQNPTDWKHSAGLSPPGAIIGCDVSGQVVKLGDGVVNKDIQVGDKVACTVHGGLFKNKGGYAQYAKAQSDLVWKVPEGLDMDKASTFGVAWVTACQALLQSQEKPFPPADAGKGEWFLVYGASSSVGLFAVSLAKAMNYKVVGVCSEKNFDLVKSYGADEVVSYRSGGDKCAEDVKRITGGGVVLGLDTISEGESTKIALGGFKEGGDEHKQLNLILPPKEEIHKIRPDVKVVNTLMYTLFGIDFNMSPVAPKPTNIPAPKSHRDFHVEICQHTPELITKYGIKSNPVTIRGGLDDVIAGWEDMKNQKVSGSKLVYKVA